MVHLPAQSSDIEVVFWLIAAALALVEGKNGGWHVPEGWDLYQTHTHARGAARQMYGSRALRPSAIIPPKNQGTHNPQSYPRPSGLDHIGHGHRVYPWPHAKQDQGDGIDGRG